MRNLKSGIPLILLGVMLLVIPPSIALAQWVEDGIALCTATGVQLHTKITTDGAGGAIITWWDYRSGNEDIYAQHVDTLGVVQWTTNGVPLCTAAGDKGHPEIVSDGAGGAIVTWHDLRGGIADIYAQRVDASGAVQWATDGVALCMATGGQGDPAITSDGAGGAIVTWKDYRNGMTNADIYAQRVDASGAVQWTADGVALCIATGMQQRPKIASDGAGGAIVTWDDGRSGDGDIYAQRVDASGVVQWTANGVALCAATEEQVFPEIVSDEGGGAILAWLDHRSGIDYDIYAQRVDASGVAQWTTNGVALCTATEYQQDPTIVPDGAEGAIVAWEDLRSGYYDIYAQRVDATGVVQWTANGLALCTATGDQEDPTIVSDGAGGAIVTWEDPRTDYGDIYAQRVDATGVTKWIMDGLALCTATGSQEDPAIVSDGAGGAIVTWCDSRGYYDIYAQKVFAMGVRSYDLPHIRSISDVPNDQGGKIELQWDRCFVVDDPNPTITYYSVWRRLPGASSALSMGVSGVTEVSIDFGGVAHRMLEDSDDYVWEWLANIPTKLIDTYAYMVESRYDSTSSDTGWQYFVVSGHTDDPLVYCDSSPDSGYSVDNLSPCTPAGLAAELTDYCELYLHWNPNAEADLHHYALYRGSLPGFVPGEANRIGTATDTCFVDTGYDYGREYYYKVSATDVHENDSPFALLTPDMIAGAPDTRSYYGNVLFQNAPNPFVSSTRIAFSIKEAGYVRLSIYDARGRLVRLLVDEVRGSSRYVEEWDGKDTSGRPVASGTYFYRLEAPGWTAVKKMTYAR